MKKTLLIVAALNLSACATMIDMADSAAGLGQLSVDTNSFDNATVIKLTPDSLYNPEKTFSSVDTKLGAIWSSKSPSIVSLILKDEGTINGSGYTSFSGISVKVDGQTKHYDTGLTNIENSGYNSVAGTVFTSSSSLAAMSLEDFEAMLSADSCMMKISRSSGYEQANCTMDRIPGGKKTAILGFRKLLAEIKINLALQ